MSKKKRVQQTVRKVTKKKEEGYGFDGAYRSIMSGKDADNQTKYPFDGAYQRIWRAPNTIMKE